LLSLIHMSNSKNEALQRVREINEKRFLFYLIDLLDGGELEAVFAKHSIGAVIHFASLKVVGES
jgi:UDP-glucose 4-epimerase